MNIDLTKIVDNGGGYLEPGEYVVRIFDLTYRDAKDKPVMDVTFKGPTGSIRDTFWLTENAMWRVKKLAVAAGIKEEEFCTFNTDDLRGKLVTIRVIKETSPKDGKLYSVVKDFWAAEKQPEDDDFDPETMFEQPRQQSHRADPF